MQHDPHCNRIANGAFSPGDWEVAPQKSEGLAAWRRFGKPEGASSGSYKEPPEESKWLTQTLNMPEYPLNRVP
jgi:hypothetical protein